MIVARAYRHRIVFNLEQDALARSFAGMTRLIYNETLAYKKMMYRETGSSPSIFELKRELKAIKKTLGLEFFGEAPHHSLCEAMLNLKKAFDRFYRGEASFPRFKKRGVGDSFSFPDKKQIKTNHPDRSGQVFLPKLKWVSVTNSYPRLGTRLYEGELRNVTVSRAADGWYINISALVEIADPVTPVGAPIGIDLGVANSIATTSGDLISLPVETRRESVRYARLQQRFAGQERGSRNADKTKRRMGWLRKRALDRRKDAMHKTTTRLAKTHSLIIVEDLKVKQMTRSAKGTLEKPGTNVRAKSGLNRVILKQAWGELGRQLAYKTKWYGSELVMVDPKNTSRECSACGHTSPTNRKTQAVFECEACRHEAHADLNAAKNILHRGLETTTGTEGTSGTETLRVSKPAKRKQTRNGVSRDTRKKQTV